MTDICRSVNMITNKNDVSVNETSHDHEREMIPMYKVHDVPEIITCHIKAKYANIVRRS